MTIPENSLAVYKNKPALVKETADGKILISLINGEQVRVREKDIELIHPGPLKDFGNIAADIDGSLESGAAAGTIREAWELTLEENGPLSLKELAELAFGEYNPASAWAAFRLLLDGLYFTGGPGAITVRSRNEVEAEEQKRADKQKESGERERFLERLKNRCMELPADNRFMQDVEALACGKSPKSRTMKDLGLSETPEDAHALLLDTGCWTSHINPHPGRFGLSVVSAQCGIDSPPQEERHDLRYLAAFAIDSPWSNDPDDAVSIERDGEQQILYVHVADPASVIGVDSEVEREARDRGATLYLPEGSARMLADETLPLFALGLAESSPALTFKITLNSGGEIDKTEIFPSIVNVQRLTYENADRLLDSGDNTESAALLRDLYALAEQNLRRRINAGAVGIDLPEIHISLKQGQVSVEPVIAYRSANMVRECMLIAGEGAGLWAAARNLSFPFVSQETGDLPKEILPGLAGSCQLRRCMRPRTLSVKPGHHWGLGLDTYTQVTSPLRRYTDLLAHIQIRTLLSGGQPLSGDEVLMRLAAGEAAAAAVMKAERASHSHWIMVYLSDKKDSIWEAVALEKKGHRWVLIIPALALETELPIREDIAPNETLKLTLKSVNIPKGEAVFIH